MLDAVHGIDVVHVLGNVEIDVQPGLCVVGERRSARQPPSEVGRDTPCASRWLALE